MFLNTSFKFRKNHYYLIKNSLTPQRLTTSQYKQIDKITVRSYKSNSIIAGEYNAIRRILGRKTEKLFRLVLKKKANVMVTAKPREIRMGKGKGAFSHVHLPVRIGQSLCSIAWCHRLPKALFLGSVKKAMKKSGLCLHF